MFMDFFITYNPNKNSVTGLKINFTNLDPSIINDWFIDNRHIFQNTESRIGNYDREYILKPEQIPNDIINSCLHYITNETDNYRFMGFNHLINDEDFNQNRNALLTYFNNLV